jgi:hypothetical protein
MNVDEIEKRFAPQMKAEWQVPKLTLKKNNRGFNQILAYLFQTRIFI